MGRSRTKVKLGSEQRAACERMSRVLLVSGRLVVLRLRVLCGWLRAFAVLVRMLGHDLAKEQ